jgi:hypothetical protein
MCASEWRRLKSNSPRLLAKPDVLKREQADAGAVVTQLHAAENVVEKGHAMSPRDRPSPSPLLRRWNGGWSMPRCRWKRQQSRGDNMENTNRHSRPIRQ